MQIEPDINLNIIEKWIESERTHDQNCSLKSQSDFLGPSTRRQCTDLFCLILFLLLNFGLGGVLYYIIQSGGISRLGHGSDFRGDVCGTGNLTPKAYTYFPSPEDITIVLCVDSCPSKVVAKSICYYDTDGVTLLPVWGCWDSVPSTVFAYYCLPQDSTNRHHVIDAFFFDQNLMKRGGGDVIYVRFTQTWEVVCIGVCFSLIFAIVLLIVFSKPGNT